MMAEKPKHRSGLSVKRLGNAFFFLDRLRESGVTNMFASSPYVEREFKMKRAAAITVTSDWMKTFSDKPAEERAIQALSLTKEK